MALLGSSVDPRLFMQDYSGFTRAAEIQAQGMQNLGASIGGAIESYAEAKEKRKKIDASTKASRAGIESAIKLGDAYGIDIKSSLEPILAKMDDPNTTPIEAAMYGEEAKNRITNVLNMGITASEREGAQQRAMMEQQYKAAQLGMKAEELGLQRQKAAMEEGELKETEISIFDPELGKERKEKVQIDKQGQYYDPETKRPIINKEKFFYGEEGGLGELPPTSQVGGGTADLIAGAANGTFNISYKTRDQLPASSPTSRQISLDFNAAPSKNAKGIEIIIPNNATEQERQLAQEYVAKTQQYFAERGVNVPARGVRTAKENGRGTPNRFHTEPFFVGDAASRSVMEKDPDGYAQVLASTLGRIPGAMFIPPHKSNDPGAADGNFNERDFAKGSIIPALERLSQQRSAQASPVGIDNALAMGGDMTQQAMGTPEQQAMLSQQIEQGTGMATAQNMPQGAMPTEPSMGTQQPQLPQPQRRMVRGIPADGGKAAPTMMTADQVQNLASQGYRVNAMPNADGTFMVSGVTVGGQPGMEIEQTPGGGFRLVQGAGVGGKYKQAAQEREKQQSQRSIFGAQDAYRALREFDAGVMKGSGVLASAYKKGAQFLPGTPEYKVAQDLIKPLKSSIAKESLDAMRASSPSGGALGNSSNADIDLLKSKYGSLEIETDPKIWRQNLNRFIEAQLDTIHGTIQDRERLLKENKISKDEFLEIQSLYPAFTMSATGETVPRQMDSTSQKPQETEAERILRELGE